MNWLRNTIRKAMHKKEIPVVYVEDVDEVTDEIEKALWKLKDDLDLPTEEVDIAVTGRRTVRGKRF